MISENYQVNYSVGNGEYLPANTNVKELAERGNIITSNNKNIKFSFIKNGTNIKIQFYGNNIKDSYFELPLIYYLGYKATLDVNGKEHNLIVEKGSNNIVKVDLSDYTNGTIYVKYGGSILQHISLVISIITLILLIIYVVIKKK